MRYPLACWGAKGPARFPGGALQPLLERSAHPEAPIWRFAPFSDGEESCGGDPIATLDDLGELIRRRDCSAKIGSAWERKRLRRAGVLLPDRREKLA